MLDHVLYTLSLCARSLVNIAQDTNKIKGRLQIDVYTNAKDFSSLHGRAEQAQHEFCSIGL